MKPIHKNTLFFSIFLIGVFSLTLSYVTYSMGHLTSLEIFPIYFFTLFFMIAGLFFLTTSIYLFFKYINVSNSNFWKNHKKEIKGKKRTFSTKTRY
jgi:hypothetical protein